MLVERAMLRLAFLVFNLDTENPVLNLAESERIPIQVAG